MTTAPKRRRRLFPRSLEEVVKQATQPMMTKQGKLYSALLRDWTKIVGPERAAVTKPDRLQFPTTDASGATLHLAVRPAVAPELTYVTEQILEQCARYFGYRAVVRLVIHPTHDLFADAPEISTSPTPPASAKPASTADDNDIDAILMRIGQHVASKVVKKDETR